MFKNLVFNKGFQKKYKKMSEHPTPIRSKFFGRRQSRPLKKEHQAIYDELSPKLSIDPKDLKIPSAPLFLEIGFGSGEHLAEKAQQNPNHIFWGCEPYVNGMATFLKKIKTHNLENVNIYGYDAQNILQNLPDTSLDGAFLLFADPWPKKRHYKRRFIQNDTISAMHRILKPGAYFKIATDHADYLTWILDRFDRHTHLFKQIRNDIYDRPKIEDWPRTRYEIWAEEEGRTSGFMIYERLP